MPRTSREITVGYMDNLGPGYRYQVTLPAGTRVKFVSGLGGGWAVDDIPLLMNLTGNTHDPKYRYCWLPADVIEGV